ncbi:MAG TPA: right-handed parallel beta-helix repeat-containing protein [Candidatus Binatia bacterium]|nr:right-handed parallel beta-helix repeat-containing protein [Candidatus Binatia bacterium]
MGLTTHFKRYVTVFVLAGLGLIVTGQGVLHAAASNGWTGDEPLDAPAPLRTLYVDRDSKGGPCNDNYSPTANAGASPAGSKPWCTLGVAGINASAGDLVLVRSGSTPYTEPSPRGLIPAVLNLAHLGTADHPIIYKAYPGERPVLDPLGKIAGILLPGWDCNDDPANCVTFGVSVGIDPPVEACPNNHCDYYTVIDGFTFTNWNVWNNDPNPSVFHFAQYALAFQGPPFGANHLGHITVRNCEVGPNGGGGALYTKGVYAFTFEYNYVHDNNTHGWTSPLNFWTPLGHLDGQNTVRGNFVANNHDSAHPSCLEKYCHGGTNSCEDSVRGFGDLCPCFDNANCQNGSCVDNPGGGGCSNQAAGRDGNTEGHGMIIDSGGADSDFLIESNVIYGNGGTCIAVFQSDNVNLRNNTCDNNGQRGRRNDGEIITWGDHLQVENDIVVTRSTGTCGCSTNADCGTGTGWCAPSTATEQHLANTCVTGAKSVCSSRRDCLHGNECVSPIALGQTYGASTIFPADPATNSEGSNMLFCPNPALTKIIRLANDVQITLHQFKASSNARTYGWSDGDLGSDPLFIGAPDFRLQAGSPAINSGDPTNHAPKDVLGDEYTTPDRGAFKD